MTAGRVVHGFHAVTSRLRQSPSGVLELWVDVARKDGRMRDLLHLATERGVRAMQVGSARLSGIAGTSRHQGVAASVEPLRLASHVEDIVETAAGPLLLLLLDGIQDPHNLGACLRVADAFGANAVVAPRDRAVGLNATVSRVACGAAEVVPFIMVTNLVRTMKYLRGSGIWLIGTDSNAAEPLASVDLRAPAALVLGAEGEGLRRLTREHCDRLVRIPMFGSVQSINVSTAASVCLYEACRQRSDGDA